MSGKELAGQKKTLRERGVCVVIPTYNNGRTIGHVVEETLAQCDDVIVVDDGSTDGTQKVLEGMANALQHEGEPRQGVTLVTLPKNQGKGMALKQGFKRALDMGFAYAITLDGDGQHFPEDIATLLKANQAHPGALIVGKRIEVEENKPSATAAEESRQRKGSRFANRFSNFWFWVQTGRWLDDTQTGYRLYPLHRLYGLSLLTARYEAELELLVMASWHGVELVQTPVKVYYPPQEERVSHFRPGMDFLRISVLNTVLCLLAVVYGLPLRLFRAIASLLRTVYSFLFFVFFILVVITPLAWVYLHVGGKLLHLHLLIYHALRFVMIRHGIPGTTFTTKVAEGVGFDKPRVIICNHQSHLDLACQLVFTPKMVFLTNDWVWNNPFYGFLIRHAEYYPVHDGIDALMPRLRSLVERGYSIAVYPEGTRSSDCRIGRFHQGAFHIAQELGVDILPMYLYGPGRILPKKSHILHKGPLYVEVDRPVDQATLRAMGDPRAQARVMRQQYIRKYEAIANRIERNEY